MTRVRAPFAKQLQSLDEPVREHSDKIELVLGIGKIEVWFFVVHLQ
jgi:hypothetical protein